MRARRVLEVALLMLVLGTGCPEFHKKGGFIDRAAAKDIAENTGVARPPLCADGSQAEWSCDESSEDSEEDCGWRCP